MLPTKIDYNLQEKSFFDPCINVRPKLSGFQMYDQIKGINNYPEFALGQHGFTANEFTKLHSYNFSGKIIKVQVIHTEIKMDDLGVVFDIDDGTQGTFEQNFFPCSPSTYTYQVAQVYPRVIEVTLTMDDGSNIKMGDASDIKNFRVTEYNINPSQQLVGFRTYSKPLQAMISGKNILSKYPIMGYLGVVVIEQNCICNCPQIPKDFTASQPYLGANYINLQWNSVSTNGYQLKIQDMSTGQIQPTVSIGNVQSYIVYNLPLGNTFYLSLTPTRIATQGQCAEASAYQTVTLKKVQSLQAPTNVLTMSTQQCSAQNQKIDIYWTIDQNTDISQITSYKVEIANNKQGPYNQANCQFSNLMTTNPSCSVSVYNLVNSYGFSNGSPIYARVQMKSQKGTTDFSLPGSGAQILFAPSPVQGLTLTNTNSNYLLRWSPQSKSDRGGSEPNNIFYKVYVTPSKFVNGQELPFQQQISGSDTQFIITPSNVPSGLQNNVDYYLYVVTNSYSPPCKSDPSLFIPIKQQGSAPKQPTCVTTKLVDQNIKITWSPAASNEKVNYYLIYVRTSQGLYQPTSALINTNCNTKDLNSLYDIYYQQYSCNVPLTELYTNPFWLSPGSQIEVQVSAVNANGQSPRTNSGGCGSNAVLAGKPDAPMTVKSTNQNNVCRMTWDPPLQSGGSDIVSYTIYDESKNIVEIQDKNSRVWEITSPTSTCVKRTYYVTATNQFGESLLSNGVQCNNAKIPDFRNLKRFKHSNKVNRQFRFLGQHLKVSAPLLQNTKFM